MLHIALQAAFGWASTRSFQFAVKDPDYRPPSSMMDFMSPRMAMGPMGNELPASASREYLFRIIDPNEPTPFWGTDRMHEGIRRHPNTPEVRADKCKLFQLFDDAQFQSM